jgi:hypothetical protein
MDRPIVVIMHLGNGERLLDIEHPPGVEPRPIVLCEMGAHMLQKELLHDAGFRVTARIPARYPAEAVDIPATKPFEKCSLCGVFYRDTSPSLCPLCKKDEGGPYG